MSECPMCKEVLGTNAHCVQCQKGRVLHVTKAADLPTRITRDDLARVDTLVRELDQRSDPALQLRTLAEVASFMAKLQVPDIAIDEDVFTALTTRDSRQSVLLGYSVLVLSVLTQK